MVGMKNDTGKIRYSLLTRGLSIPLWYIAQVLEHGAKKYAPNSWQDVPDAKQRYEDALDRHLSRWRLGELVDPESGLHHLQHAAVNILFLLYFYKGELREQDYVSPKV